MSPTSRLTPLDVTLIGFGTAYALSELNLMRMVGPAAGGVYREIQTSPSAAAYRKSVARLTPTMRKRLRSHYFPNFGHPLLYAIALRTGGQRLAQLVPLAPAVQTFLTVGPCVGAAADITENVVRLRLLADDDAVTDLSVRTASALAVTKWTLAVVPLAYMSTRFVPFWLRILRDR
ncbi:hypothetical protein [uncultured Williamsia sp.]|uniref:hypothetical protein n=1 Tax=uncultured Williamsia sp. TaxID=259311 RepID=UPI002613C1DE|nr:hypothetical protein [uncultured Williamsia sp.]